MLQDENKEKDKTIAELRIELKKLDDRQWFRSFII
jgi:hypothetical protein